MKSNMIKFLAPAALAALISFAPATASAAGGNKTGSNMEKKMRQVSGEIVDMKEVEIRGANVKNKIVMIETTKNKRHLVIDLGPTGGLAGMTLNKGEKISVQGPVKQIRDQRVLIADRLKVDGKMMQIGRDQEKKMADAKGKK